MSGELFKDAGLISGSEILRILKSILFRLKQEVESQVYRLKLLKG